MTQLPSNEYIGNAARNEGDGKAFFEQLRDRLAEMLGNAAESTLTLASDAITLTASVHKVDTEASAVSDNLATISTTGVPDGHIVMLRSVNAGRVVTVKHGTGNILLRAAADLALVTTDYLILQLIGSTWTEVSLQGAIRATFLTTKGDLITFGTALARLAVGTNNQILAADSAAANGIKWATAPAGFKSVQVFTANGTWTKPAGVTQAIVEVVGGGGGGGGCADPAAGEGAVGGGGGAGGYARELIDVSAIASEAVTVGAAGSGGAAGNNAGTAGGNSSFGAHCSGNGGSPGSGGAAAATAAVTAGGAGGTATGGTINIAGGAGGYGIVNGGNVSTCGPGGSTPVGQGGSLVCVIDGSGGGEVGTGHGSGGSGGCSHGTGGSKAGGNGAAGIVIVWEYGYTA